MGVKILSVGAWTPSKVLTNDDLTKMVDTSDEWIRTMTGICERRIADEDTATSDIAYNAAKIALERAKINADELDMIIVATATPDYIGFPATACIVQDRIGATKAGAFDLVAGCSGLSYAIEVARGLINNGRMKNIMIIGAEKLSSIVNWNDRSTCCLFGDGAGSLILSKGSDADGDIIDSIVRADGSGECALKINAGGSRNPIKDTLPDITERTLYMDGQAVYNFAVKVNTEMVKELLERHNLTADDIAWIVPHQANYRIIKAASKRLKLDESKFYMNLKDYGNTSAASIGIALNEMHEKGLLKRGDYIITMGFGAGLTYAANLIKY
ncbi:ketoacyl-ACP synthase III [Thiospirochaeta perfilievii]|uniref:Beta-ketoacyl-[acyl-carrier-protein] synthase III n=1 Tax=Thiospirochaeta perfilievii TaxID=252967 RepID=A0A5C1Q6Z2_9SPIO|nr:beta-ketoacyl-ACP synthase III [Thiospirochaeta perfilievii]QEN03765.1 ketoacyl-ACP synthase III [Thiospirochaeta perfilievii]